MVDSSFYHSDDPGRIIQSFCIVGLNENKITRYDEEYKKPSFIQKIDIVKKSILISRNIYEPKTNEKWHSINKEHWLRVEFNTVYERPITAIKVIECDYESPEYLVCFFKFIFIDFF